MKIWIHSLIHTRLSQDLKSYCNVWMEEISRGWLMFPLYSWLWTKLEVIDDAVEMLTSFVIKDLHNCFLGLARERVNEDDVFAKREKKMRVNPGGLFHVSFSSCCRLFWNWCSLLVWQGREGRKEGRVTLLQYYDLPSVSWFCAGSEPSSRLFFFSSSCIAIDAREGIRSVKLSEWTHEKDWLLTLGRKREKLNRSLWFSSCLR